MEIVSKKKSGQKLLLWVFIIFPVLLIPMGFSYFKKQNHNIVKELNKNSLYMQISQDGMQVGKGEADKYINLLKSEKIKKGTTVGGELEKSFSSVPGRCRGWEYHIHNNEKYVCYVVRSHPGDFLAFIWCVNETYGDVNFYPVNETALLINGLQKENGSYDESLKDEKEGDRQVIHYLNDREWAFDNEEYYKKTLQNASQKFGMSESTVEKLWGDHTEKWVRLRDSKK